MEKISKAQIKMVRSLQQKKFRDELGLFVAEGDKCVEELRKAFELVYRIQSTEHSTQTGSLLATPTEIEQMSSLRTPQGVIGVFKKCHQPSAVSIQNDLMLALDGVQDPGNLGTIIRTCDWFGVHDIFCSLDTADCYNPKVVQATMGALARVRVHYVDLPEWLKTYRAQRPEQRPIYGTLLEGKNMYEVLKPSEVSRQTSAVIVMGNEGNGISQAVRQLITHPILIPSYPKNEETSEVIESLNVSIATAIVLAEFRRPR
jgi:TrmH family RNA methyltransferase